MTTTTQFALRIVHCALCIILAALPAAAQQDIVEGEDLPQANVSADLGGKTMRVRNWKWPMWDGYSMSVTNGTLVVAGEMSPRHGETDILAGGTLRFEKGSTFAPGLQDAGPRTTSIHPGGTLDLSHGRFQPFNARFTMEPGSTVLLGCDLSPTKHGHGWRAKGGRLIVTDHVNFNMNEFFVDTNAVLEVEVAEDKIADMSSVTLAPGAELKETGTGILIRSHDDPRLAMCQTIRALGRLEIHAQCDTANGC